MNAWRVLGGACLVLASAAHSTTPEQEVDFAARDAERVLNRAVIPGDAYGANEVLQTVVKRLISAAPDPTLADCRAQLMKGERPAVFALPNCRVYVTTALFMTLENEAQLATLLAREVAHVQLHSAAKQRVLMAKRENDAKSFLFVLAALSGSGNATPSYGANAPTVSDATGDLIWRVSVGGYAAELETTADGAGAARFRAAGYSPADAIRALELLSEEAPKDCGCSVPLLANTNYLDARLASLRKYTAAPSDVAMAPSAEYAAHTARLRLEQVHVLINAGKYDDASRVLAEQVVAQGENGQTYFLAGEMARRQGSATRADALEAYQKGAKFADAPPALFLNLGLMAHEDGQHEVAALAFQEYLRLNPNAVEASLIRQILGQPTPSPEN